MKRVYVGNLGFGVTEQTIRSLFEVYGTVEAPPRPDKRQILT